MHLRKREEAGHVHIEKGCPGRKPRTWVQLTSAGRRTFADSLCAIEQLISQLR